MLYPLFGLKKWVQSSFWGNGIKMKLVLILRQRYQNEACPHFEAMVSKWSLSSIWGNGIKMKLVLILRNWYQNEACHHFEDVASKWRLSLLSGYNRESVILEMILKHEMGHFHRFAFRFLKIVFLWLLHGNRSSIIVMKWLVSKIELSFG